MIKMLAMTVLCVDVFPQTDEVYVGGNSLNFAVQAVKSQAGQVAVLGAVGNDTYGELVRSYLASRHIDTSHVHTLACNTASNRIYCDEKGDRYFLPDSWDGGAYAAYRVTPEDMAFINGFDLVAITCHDPSFESVIQGKESFRLVVDYLDYRDFSLMERAINQTDITFISGDDAVVETLQALSRNKEALIVVTLGSKGSVALLKGEAFYQAAEPVKEVVDTTGCGDAFQAAFSLSWFKDFDVKKALKAGSVAASHVLGHRGGVD